MPTPSDPADLVTSEFEAVPLGEVLSKPVTALLGVTDDAAAALHDIGVDTVFDLALSKVFSAAVQLAHAATDAGSAFARFGSPPSDLLAPGAGESTGISDLRFEPVDILAGIPDPTAFKAALGVETVRDLSVYPPFRAATTLVAEAYFPDQQDGFDPEAPQDLLPTSGEYPTERVQYTTLVLDRLLRPDGAPALVDVASSEFQPIDIAPVAAPDFGFTTLGLGALLTFNQSWFMQGVTLGHLLHSMALAPGESTRIAVVDWSRRTSAGQTEAVGETEDLTQDTTRNRSISEVTQAVAREAQTGFSETESESTTKQAGASGGLSIGPVGFGASASIAKTKTSASSYATTAGSREVGASMLQQANDRTHQHAHASRTRRASVVREVSQSEHEQVSTRVVTNYNHMHAMTVQYYEVLQVYRTETALTRCDRVVFVPFKLIDFGNESLLRRFRSTLVDAALTPAVREALVNYDTLEIVPDRRVRFPDLGGTIDEAVVSGMNLRMATMRARRPVEGPDEEPQRAPEEPVRPPLGVPGAGDVTQVLWAGAGRRLSSILGAASVRRGSESLFVPSDVRVVDGQVRSAAGDAVSLTYHRADGSSINDLSLSVPLAEIARISLIGASQTTDVEATATLTLARNGVVFPLELPTVTVERGSANTPLIRLQTASADVNLVDHLTANRLHYSQAVFRDLDAAMIAGLLGPYSIELNGTTFPLVQVAEPTPLRIVGNALAFKINTDTVNDLEWQAFMDQRGLDIGEAKVDLVPLSSGGIFAEAVLGRYNSAEKLDMTRFWDWQDSPLPLQPTEIAAIQTGTRATAEDLKASPLSQPIVAITPPAALPDPTGMAGVLAAIQNGGMFRDMSGLAETVKLASEAIKASSAGATSVGAQASKNMEIAVTADTERQRIAADLAKAKAGKALGDKSESAKGAAVNEVDKRTGGGKGAAEPGGAGSTGAPGGPTPGGSPRPAAPGGTPGGTAGGTAGGGGARGGGSPGTAPSTGNVALDQIVGNDDLTRRYLGMTDDSPVPTPTVTAEGVPLQEWDAYGLAYTLMFKASGAPEPDFPSEAQLEQVVTSGQWKPTQPQDFEPLLLGDESRASNSFGSILLPLSLMPEGSLRTLNIVAHATQVIRLAFSATFVFDEALGELRTIHDDPETFPLSRLDFNELLDLTGDQPIEVQGGTRVRLADVRRAFPVDGEVRVFNLTNPLRAEYVQALANFFQVRTTGFVERPVRVLAELVAVTEPASERVLSKKVSVGFLGDEVGTTVDAFTQLLSLDRSITGTYTAFPRR
jgi:hypothetical protein